jgi:hypothetical protein
VASARRFSHRLVYRRCLVSACQPGFDGIDTNWKRVASAAALAKMVVESFGSSSARRLLAQSVAIAEAIAATEDASDQLDECSRAFATLLTKGAAGHCESLSVQSLGTAQRLIQTLCESLSGQVSTLEQVCPHATAGTPQPAQQPLISDNREANGTILVWTGQHERADGFAEHAACINI